MTSFNRQGTPDEKTLKDQVLSFTPAEAEQWVEDNVTDLQSAKMVLKKLAKISVALARRVENGN